MAWTVAQSLLLIIIFSGLAGCVAFVGSYLLFLHIRRGQRFNTNTPEVTREPHPYSWRTRVVWVKYRLGSVGRWTRLRIFELASGPIEYATCPTSFTRSSSDKSNVSDAVVSFLMDAPQRLRSYAASIDSSFRKGKARSFWTNEEVFIAATGHRLPVVPHISSVSRHEGGVMPSCIQICQTTGRQFQRRVRLVYRRAVNRLWLEALHYRLCQVLLDNLRVSNREARLGHVVNWWQL